jgi:uroporphyrinogen decarboxylase
VQDFDFDVAILFSDILFPLQGLGMGLQYTDHGPRLDWTLAERGVAPLLDHATALESLRFQSAALMETRRLLPSHKSLIGFIGGPWTLFGYAVQGKHEGGLLETKRQLPLWEAFCDRIIPLLIDNVELQFQGGAELVMVFDTAAGELSPALYQQRVLPQLKRLADRFPNRLGYYARGTTWDHHDHSALSWAGEGRDHRWSLSRLLKSPQRRGFLQGNFDQALLFQDFESFKKSLKDWLDPILALSPEEQRGWICGLGHGVLPKTPEAHVRFFVDFVRRSFDS